MSPELGDVQYRTVVDLPAGIGPSRWIGDVYEFTWREVGGFKGWMPDPSNRGSSHAWTRRGLQRKLNRRVRFLQASAAERRARRDRLEAAKISLP